MKKKLVFTITKSNWGGAQKYVYTLAHEASKTRNFDVTVVSGNDGELLHKLRSLGITTRVLPLANSLNPFRLIPEIASYYSFFKEHGPDIIHANSNKAGIISALAGALYKAQSRRRVLSLFTIHGHAFNESRSYISKLYIMCAEVYMLALIDKVICVSKKVYDDIPLSFLFAAKSSVIYNGLPLLHFYTKENARERLGITDHTTHHFATIAELNDNKNHVYLLRELHSRKEPYIYHIIGTGVNEPYIRRFIHDHNMSDKVVLHGHLDDAYAYLRAFDLFILPSKTEALAYVIQEAGQAGIKTIASRVGGLPELLPQEFLFALHNTHELHDLLSRLETLPLHTTYFKQEDMVQQTFNLYTQGTLL